jgi:predicted membrane protein
MTTSRMTEHEAKTVPGAGHSPLYGSVARAVSLAIAVAISVSLLAWPILVVSADGSVDHRWLTLLMWSMAAGFVHGVGFVPRNRLLRVALGPVAAWGMSMLAVLALSAS